MMKDLFAYFGMAILIVITDFAIVFTLASSDKLHSENVYLGGFIVNAVLLSIALSFMILGV